MTKPTIRLTMDASDLPVGNYHMRIISIEKDKSEDGEITTKLVVELTNEQGIKYFIRNSIFI